MKSKKEYYEIHAENSKNANCPDDVKCEDFTVLAECHIQHHPGSTKLQGLSNSGKEKIDSYRARGYWLGVMVGGRLVTLEN